MYNKIIVKCSEEEAKQIMEEIKGKNGVVDFNSIIPMPMSIPNYATDERELLEALAAFCAIQQVPWPKMDVVRDRYVRSMYSRYVNKEFVVSRLPVRIMYLIGQLVYHNLTTNGYLYWYDWSRNNWGVKWNAIDPEVKLDKGKLIITFYSPANIPSEIIETLAKKHPNAKFSGYFEEDNNGADCYVTLHDSVNGNKKVKVN